MVRQTIAGSLSEPVPYISCAEAERSNNREKSGIVPLRIKGPRNHQQSHQQGHNHKILTQISRFFTTNQEQGYGKMERYSP